MPIIETASGKLSGIRHGAVDAYLGIPYAAPPVGALRFQSPKPPVAWSGVRDATQFGAGPLQKIVAPGSWIYPPTLAMSEDCLSLNVWTPAGAENLPVVVWIYGGGFRTGATSMPVFDGQRLAETANVVLVTIGHRNSALGWMAHPDFRDPETGASANWGLQDQVQALHWVRQNIAAFGGDPGRVTLGGQSGGAINSIMITQNPRNQGLVHRLLLLSPPYIAPPGFATQADAATIVEELAQALGTSVVGLRDIPAEDLERAEIAQWRSGRVNIATGRFYRGPVADGITMVDWPAALELPPIPILFGYTRNEGAYWTDLANADGTANPVPPQTPAGRQACSAFLSNILHAPEDRIAQMVDRYFDALEGNSVLAPSGAMAEILGDALLRQYGLNAGARAARAGRTDVRMFEYALPLLSPGRGTPHCSELPIVFGTFADPYYREKMGEGAFQQTLSTLMMQAFGAFAASGNPTTAQIPEWPAFTAEPGTTVVFGADGVPAAVGSMANAELLSGFEGWGLQFADRN